MLCNKLDLNSNGMANKYDITSYLSDIEFCMVRLRNAVGLQ